MEPQHVSLQNNNWTSYVWHKWNRFPLFYRVWGICRKTNSDRRNQLDMTHWENIKIIRRQSKGGWWKRLWGSVGASVMDDQTTDRRQTTHRAETRGRVNKEEDCTMLFVDGGFSIDIIFDQSLWRWKQAHRKEKWRKPTWEVEKERKR